MPPSAWRSPDHRIVASVNSGFRAPNINDVSSFGPFDFGIEVPSPDLEPERTLSVELGHKMRTGSFSSQVAFYNTRLLDLLTRVPSSFMGSEFIDGERVYQKTNLEEAVIRGFEGEAEFLFGADLRLHGSVIYTFGEATATGEPLGRIPPLHGRIAVRQPLSKLWWLGEWLWATKQDRLSGGVSTTTESRTAGPC
jgi:outer membrane receptor protein involved in Fe transport